MTEKIEIENRFLNLETELDKLLRGNNNYAINSKIVELSSLIEGNPFLYENFLKKIVSVPKKYIVLTNPFLKDVGSKNVANHLLQNDKNLFEFLEVKNYKFSKYKEFETKYSDKTFMNIHVKYVGSDLLRPIFLSTNFNEDGVVSSNGNELIFTKYRSEYRDSFGNYCFSKLSFNCEDEILNKNFPDWKRVIPTKCEVTISFDSNKLFNFLKNAKEYLLFNSTTKTICLEFGNGTCFFANADFLTNCIDVMSKLGHGELEMIYVGVNKAFLICPKNTFCNIEEFKEDFILIMPQFINGDVILDPIYNLNDSSVRFCDDGKKYFF